MVIVAKKRYILEYMQGFMQVFGDSSPDLMQFRNCRRDANVKKLPSPVGSEAA